MTTRRQLLQWSAATLGVIVSALARSTESDLPKPGWPPPEKEREALAQLTAARG